MAIDNNDFTHEFQIYSTDKNAGTMGTGKFLLFDNNINAVKVESVDNIKIGGGSNGRVLATDGEGNLRWISAAAVTGGISSYDELDNVPDLSVYAQTSSLAAVATSGSYNDLTNKPTIPDLTDYATEAWVNSQGFGSGSGSGATTLSALTDVALEGPVEGSVLTWNDTQGHWENRSLPTANEITNTSPEGSIYSVSVGTNGVVIMTTARGGIEFGAMPEVGGPTHFHIMRPAGDNGTDLYFGDDYNYVLQRPSAYGGAPAYGVEIGANDNNGGDQQVWRFGTDGGLVFPDATVQTTAYTGSGNASTGDITFSGGALRNSNDNTVRLESLDINQTASYNFTPQGGDYSTAVWNGTSITFNDPTSSVQQAIWALNNFSTIEIQINGQWQTVTSGGAYTPSLPQAQRLDLNQTAVGGPLNIDEVQIVINEGTSSFVEIDGTDFEVNVQNDIRMYANDTFLLSNKGAGESINIETNDGEHTWEFLSDGNLQLPDGGTIVDINGNSVLGGGTTLPTNASGYLVNDGSGNLSWAAGDGTFSGNYNDLTNKPTIRIAVPTGSGPGGNLQADSLALAGLNPTENIPSTYGGDLILQGGVGGANGDLYGEVRIKSGTIGANYEWHFTTDKKIKLPAGGSIVDSTGATAFVSLATLKQVVADSTDFADFQSRIAGM
jgi:hypothetical protein